MDTVFFFPDSGEDAQWADGDILNPPEAGKPLRVVFEIPIRLRHLPNLEIIWWAERIKKYLLSLRYFKQNIQHLMALVSFLMLSVIDMRLLTESSTEKNQPAGGLYVYRKIYKNNENPSGVSCL